ncbi:hypothetical protein QTN25_004541 [Entamoeba marina]
MQNMQHATQPSCCFKRRCVSCAYLTPFVNEKCLNYYSLCKLSVGDENLFFDEVENEILSILDSGLSQTQTTEKLIVFDKDIRIERSRNPGLR